MTDDHTSSTSATPRSSSEHVLRSVTSVEDNNIDSNGINGHKVPSYIGISCAINGYSNYNRYSSSSCSLSSRHCLYNYNGASHKPVICVINDINDVNNHSNGNNNDNNDKQLNCGASTDIANNSILQQRIASLYGESFAADWKKQVKRQNNKIRSPSCPPSRCKDYDKQRDNDNNKSCDNDSRKNIGMNSLHESSTNSEMFANSQNSQNSSQVPSLSAHDGNWFLTQLNDTTVELQHKIAITQKLLDDEQYVQNDIMGEEIAGKLRSAIGKANLLISQKFNQFRELCLKNISQSNGEQFKTTNEDLMGFWDMVWIQVIDVRNTFEEVNTLRDSGWKCDGVTKQQSFSPTKSKPRSKKTSPKKSLNESPKIVNDNERRSRLREAKRRMANNMANNTNQQIDDISIFTSAPKY